MADREAKVRLNLAAAGFLSQLQGLERAGKELGKAMEGVGDHAEKGSKKTTAAVSAMKKGLGAAKDSLAELGSSLKSTLATAATFGGALSAGMAIHNAEELGDVYKNLAFAIEAGTGKAVHWQDVQRRIETTANKWARSNKEVASTFQQIYDDVGDAEFAAAATEEVGKAATATGKSAQGLAVIAGQLNEKFGVTAQELPDAMAAMVAMGNKGGVTLDDMGEKLGIIGASAKLAGMGGKEGLSQVIAMMNLADGATGNLKKGITAVTGVLDSMGSPDKLKAIGKELHLSLVDKQGKPRGHALEAILAKTGGKQEMLAKVFSGEELKLVSEFGKAYQKGFGETSGSIKEKTHAGLETFKQALATAGKQTLSAADLEKKAKERLEDPARQTQLALNELEQAFTRPEMLQALGEIAKVAPKFAHVLADLIGFAGKHPLLAVAGVVGAKAGGSALASAGQDLVVSGAKGLGTKIAAEFAEKAAVSGKWSAAGSMFATTAVPLMVAAVVAAAGKEAIDKRLEEKGQESMDLGSLDEGAKRALETGDKKQISEAREALAKRIKQAEKDQGGFGGAMDSVFGALADASSVEGYQDPNKKLLGKAQESLKQLDFELARKNSDKAGAALEKTAAAAERAANALAGIAPKGTNYYLEGSNGLPPAPGNGSGSWWD